MKVSDKISWFLYIQKCLNFVFTLSIASLAWYKDLDGHIINIIISLTIVINALKIFFHPLLVSNVDA